MNRVAASFVVKWTQGYPVIDIGPVLLIPFTRKDVVTI